MKRRLAWMIVAVLVVAGLIAGAALYNRRTEPNEVVIAQFGDLLLYLPLYIAVDDGEFARQGLSVRIISTGGDDKTFAAVLSGDAQFGVADPTFTAIAGDRGAEGSVVALLINGMPNYGVSMNPNAEVITNLQQLGGKRFASVPAPSTSYAALAHLYRRGGAAPNILQTSPAGLAAAAGQPGVYGAVLIEPWASEAEIQGGRVVLSMASFFGEFALTGITTSNEFRESNPRTVEKMRAALRHGVEVIYNDPELALRIARQRFPTENPESLRRGIERMRRDGVYPRDLRMTRPAWNAAINLRIESGDYRGSAEASWSRVAPEAR